MVNLVETTTYYFKNLFSGLFLAMITTYQLSSNGIQTSLTTIIATSQAEASLWQGIFTTDGPGQGGNWTIFEAKTCKVLFITYFNGTTVIVSQVWDLWDMNPGDDSPADGFTMAVPWAFLSLGHYTDQSGTAVVGLNPFTASKTMMAWSGIDASIAPNCTLSS